MTITVERGGQRPGIESQKQEVELKQPAKRILICDTLPKKPFEQLINSCSYTADFKTNLTKDELAEIIGEYDAVVIRSKTKITEDILAKSGKLSLIVRAGVGTDNIDVDAATKKGIIVANTPDANTDSAAEHAIALMFSLARRIPQAHKSLEEGKWTPVEFKGIELKGKILGIVGLGNIGKEVAKKANGLEMRVQAYDPYATQEQAEELSVKLVSKEELLQTSDVITLHTPLTKETKKIINNISLATMKKGAIIINDSRGEVIDEEALCNAIEEGQIAGAALDVYAGEPEINPRIIRLIKDGKIVGTPHLGASTTEAQERVAMDAAEIVKKVFEGEIVRGTINLPRISPEIMREQSPYAQAASKFATLAFLISSGRIGKVDIEYFGDIATQLDSRLIEASIIKGLVEPISEEPVNLVNYKNVATRRGLMVKEHKDPSQNSYTSLIGITLTHNEGKTRIEGTIGHNGPQVVGINDYPVDFPLREGEHLLICENENKPGMVGLVASLLGESDINISGMSLANNSINSRHAMMAIRLETPLTDLQIEKIKMINGISTAQFISLSTLA